MNKKNSLIKRLFIILIIALLDSYEVAPPRKTNITSNVSINLHYGDKVIIQNCNFDN